MRIGLLSDVHANLFALRSAIGRLRAEGVDAWVCAGDLVGYGPHPNECVETIADLGATCVTGNHELMLLGDLPTTRAGWLARRSIDWTRGVVRADVRSYLAALPRTVRPEGMFVAHGSPDDPEEYVRTDERAAELLGSLPDERLLVLGHTHRPWLYATAGGTPYPDQDPPGTAERSLASEARFLVNPGAVGQSRQRETTPRARFALVDLERAQVRFFAEPYDVRATRAALRARRLSRDSVHIRPGRLPTATRRARRVVGLVSARLHGRPGPPTDGPG
jgi:diadenosine tetraphosphatase ApaH/serine/threonine PP2A family protein phosphatase